MTYSKKMLAFIGKQVVENHPDIALRYTAPKKRLQSLSIIEAILVHYCNKNGYTVQSMYGACYSLEPVKIFICAMCQVYDESQKGFGKQMSTVFGKQQPAISRINTEVSVRYGKDKVFTASVDKAIKVINNFKMNSDANN